MQTFLISENFYETAQVLDYKRLGKQRVEAKQIINTLTAIKNNDLYIIDKNGKRRKRGWVNHPAVLMWRGFEDTLMLYHNIMIQEWIKRGYNNTMPLLQGKVNIKLPQWLGDKKLHASHRSNLLRKDYNFYSKFGWREPANMEYIWPVSK